MTHDTKTRLQSGAKSIASQLLLAAVAATGTHLLDVIKVKDLVDAIHTEQIENSKWRVTSQAKVKQLEEVDLPSLVHGQWMMNRRLCSLMASYGEPDEECSATAYKSKSKGGS